MKRKIHPFLPLSREGVFSPFDKPTKVAEVSRAELVCHRFPDSTTWKEGDLKGDFRPSPCWGEGSPVGSSLLATDSKLRPRVGMRGDLISPFIKPTKEAGSSKAELVFHPPL